MAATRLWTIQRREQEPPEVRWELGDGELVELAPAGEAVSTVGAQAVRHLGNFVVPRQLGRVFGADGGFILFPDRELLRVPDAAFVRVDRLD